MISAVFIIAELTRLWRRDEKEGCHVRMPDTIGKAPPPQCKPFRVWGFSLYLLIYHTLSARITISLFGLLFIGLGWSGWFARQTFGLTLIVGGCIMKLYFFLEWHI
ncbi:hypothetical protein HOY82DRAFT_413886 [Tuber indicum]|nr:hypothetical protein HOY82DRAFT_413886 [Tuber indicum]